MFAFALIIAVSAAAASARVSSSGKFKVDTVEHSRKASFPKWWESFSTAVHQHRVDFGFDFS